MVIVERAIASASGLSGADYGILSRLEDLGQGSLTQQVLLASLGWNKARLSHQLTRMEARKLLRRHHPDSERHVTITILASGRKAISGARPAHAGAVREHVLRHIRPEEEEIILRLSGQLRMDEWDEWGQTESTN
ncbi:MAG TPA: MarR family winged helix-turn-helix transcriptional regulator [Bryobacteraceae bacterium]|nr:MarR family winged helix-turn-helix transcriptional regulator [Bryobacteraceae bacterium]